MLESKSRFLFVLLVVSVLASVGLTYWNTMVLEDFVIINDIEETGGDILPEDVESAETSDTLN